MRGLGNKIMVMHLLCCSRALSAQMVTEIFLIVNNTMIQISVERPVYRLNGKKIKRELAVQHIRPGKGKFIDVWVDLNDARIPIKVYNNYETLTHGYLISQERLIVVRDKEKSYTRILREKNEKIELLRNKL